MAEQDARDPDHLTTTTEQGRFCVARCTCGWRGPARRARSQARTDAADHEADVLGVRQGADDQDSR
ncbi:hypothetical protein ACPCBC_24865 [Streptomyces incarnatus]|uniref:hypothetical protein n=1 Tax=unclassified Streptomyces TaxID=2593676 RepID=UPI00119D453D|nr:MULTISPECIES: hypothetical protein [Streptomyces]QHC30198.1 hypothetical protein GR129_16630 [Streptomyces sp. HF10]WKE70920.1 hypothetical protein QHG49_18780 [Streptomyces sp. WP-1]